MSKPPAERNAQRKTNRKRIAEITSERDKIQDIFNQRFPDYVALSKPQPLTIEQTQALLGDDEAIVAVDLDKKSYVWVITKDRAEWKELSVSAEDVSKEVETLRTGLNPDSPKPFDRNLAYELYRQVLGPIEEIISQKTRLSFVLDGALTSLPPQVLITSDPERKDLGSVDWLIRKYAVTVLPSVASLNSSRRQIYSSSHQADDWLWRPGLRQTNRNRETEGGGSEPEPDQLLPRRDCRHEGTRRCVARSSRDR